jgi:hypothetical protein
MRETWMLAHTFGQHVDGGPKCALAIKAGPAVRWILQESRRFDESFDPNTSPRTSGDALPAEFLSDVRYYPLRSLRRRPHYKQVKAAESADFFVQYGSGGLLSHAEPIESTGLRLRLSYRSLELWARQVAVPREMYTIGIGRAELLRLQLLALPEPDAHAMLEEVARTSAPLLAEWLSGEVRRMTPAGWEALPAPTLSRSEATRLLAMEDPDVRLAVIRAAQGGFAPGFQAGVQAAPPPTRTAARARPRV